MKKNLVAILLVLFSAAAIAGPDNNTTEAEPKGGEIIGKVIDDASSQPMEYTSIAIFSLPDSTLVTGTVSDVNGSFELSKIPFGTYYLEVQFVGYDKNMFGPFELSRNQRSIDLGQIKLEVNTNDLAEVEIVAQQKRVEYRIDKKVVNVGEDLSSAGGTAVDVLENTPSVNVDIEGNVTMRGSGSFTVLINGKPTVLEGSDALRSIPASNIQNIELITNPSVKYDPDGNAGIINVVLKKQVEKGTTGIVNASIGNNHKYRIDALINRRINKLNYFVGGGYTDMKFLGSLQREHITYGDTTHYNMAEGNFDFLRSGANLKAGFDYDISPKSNIALEANGGLFGFGMDRSNNSHEYTDPASIDAYFSNISQMNNSAKYFGSNMSFTQIFDTTAHKIEFLASFSNRKGDDVEDLKFYSTDEFYNILEAGVATETRNLEVEDGFEYRYQVDYSKPLWNGMLEAGYQGRLDDNLTDFQYQEYDPDTDTWSTIGDNSSEISFFRNIQGAYVQYGGSAGKFQYQVGMRGEYTNREIAYENFETSYEIDRFDYYPTLHLSRQLNNDQQLMLSYSKRVNRPRSYFLDSIPNYVDKNTVRIGNPALGPEYVHSFEFGYQKGWGKNFLALEAFYRNTVDKMTRTTEYREDEDIFYQRMVNINEDHTIGTELMLNWQFTRWFNLNMSTSGYYYNLVGELYGKEVDESNFSWYANSNATFNYSKTGRVQTTFGYRGPSITAQGSAEGMWYTNLAVRQDLFKRKLSATLQIRDIFGTAKRDFTASGENFEQHIIMQREPRSIMLSLSYKINNYRQDPSDRGNGGGGMDMDAGF